MSEYFRPGDLVPVALALAAALLFTTRPGTGRTNRLVVTSYQGVFTLNMDTGSDTLVSVQVRDGTAVVQLENGLARILESPCPRGYCMATGWIGRPGQAAICIPEGLIIEVTGSEGVPDAVSY